MHSTVAIRGVAAWSCTAGRRQGKVPHGVGSTKPRHARRRLSTPRLRSGFMCILRCWAWHCRGYAQFGRAPLRQRQGWVIQRVATAQFRGAQRGCASPRPATAKQGRAPPGCAVAERCSARLSSATARLGTAWLRNAAAKQSAATLCFAVAWLATPRNGLARLGSAWIGKGDASTGMVPLGHGTAVCGGLAARRRLRVAWIGGATQRQSRPGPGPAPWRQISARLPSAPPWRSKAKPGLAMAKHGVAGLCDGKAWRGKAGQSNGNAGLGAVQRRRCKAWYCEATARLCGAPL